MDSQAQDTQEEFGVIQRTLDYNKFSTMAGNRAVDLKHVARLKQQMERNRELLGAIPILVNENWYIVDGQHRFEAARALGFPVYYIRQKHLGLMDTRHLNIAQRRWRMIDFAKSYAESGRPDYKTLLEVASQYHRIPLSTVASYLAGSRGGNGVEGFQQGEFKVVDKEDAIAGLDFLNQVIEIVGIHADRPISLALWKVLHHPDFDERVFIQKLRENPEALAFASSQRACIRSIEDVYNRHNKIATRLY